MTTKRNRELIEKLNRDNRKLNELHKSWIELARGQMVMGFMFVIALIIIYLVAI